MSYTPMQLAEAFLKTGELQDALDALNTQLADHPDDAAARRLRAQVWMRLPGEGHLEKALADFDALPDFTVDDLVRCSIIHERMEKLESALKLMESARAQNPADERLAERTMQLMMRQNQLESALALVRLQPRSWRWLQSEGDLLALLGDDITATARYGLALAQLENLPDVDSNPYLGAIRGRLLLARAHAYTRLEQIDTAREHYLLAKKRLPADPTIDFSLGRLHALEGRLEEAAALCRQSLDAASALVRQSLLDSLGEKAAFAPLAARIRS